MYHMSRKVKGYVFIVVSLIGIALMSVVTFHIKNHYRKKENLRPWKFTEFLNNGETITVRTVLVGLLYGGIIGIIDVLGIWYVLKYLRVFMPKGQILDAGIAEIYSSVLAVILGTFISYASKTIVPPDAPIPLWVDALGVLIGCSMTLFLMAVPEKML